MKKVIADLELGLINEESDDDFVKPTAKKSSEKSVMVCD